MTDERGGTPSMGRRRWLALAGGSVSLGLAGCLGDDDDGDESDDPNDSDDGDGDDAGTGDDGQNGTDSPAVTLSAVTVADRSHGEAPELLVNTDHPITVTLDSDTDDSRQVLVDLEVYAVGDPEEFPAPGDEDAIDAVVTERSPVATDSQRVDASPDSQHAVEFEGLTEELAGGPYVVVASVDRADTRAATPLTVADTADVTVEVYTVDADDGSRPESGTLFLEATFEDATLDPIEQELADLAEDHSPTVEVPLDLPTESVKLVVRDVDGSVYPPASVEVPLVRDPEPVELVAGYEFQGTNAMRFSHYLHHSREGVWPPYREYIRYGTYAANGDYHSYATYGGQTQNDLWIETTKGSPPEYGADLQAIRDEQGIVLPVHSAELGDDAFFYSSVREQWEPGEAPNRGRSTHVIVLEGLDAVTEPTLEERQFIRREEFRGRTVDVYRVNIYFPDTVHLDSQIYIDPGTGYVLRIEREPINNELEDSLEVAEFFAHGEPETADIELMQERSTPETGRGLEELPWE